MYTKSSHLKAHQRIHTGKQQRLQRLLPFAFSHSAIQMPILSHSLPLIYRCLISWNGFPSPFTPFSHFFFLLHALLVLFFGSSLTVQTRTRVSKLRNKQNCKFLCVFSNALIVPDVSHMLLLSLRPDPRQKSISQVKIFPKPIFSFAASFSPTRSPFLIPGHGPLLYHLLPLFFSLLCSF